MGSQARSIVGFVLVENKEANLIFVSVFYLIECLHFFLSILKSIDLTFLVRGFCLRHYNANVEG